MPMYRMEADGRYELYNQNDELVVKTSDINYIADIRGNNQEYKFVDTQKNS